MTHWGRRGERARRLVSVPGHRMRIPHPQDQGNPRDGVRAPTHRSARCMPIRTWLADRDLGGCRQRAVDERHGAGAP